MPSKNFMPTETQAAPFVLVDGSYFLFRAYFGLPPMKTSAGLPTNAVRGAVMALQKLMRRYQPSHMAVVFDTPEPTFRHHLSPDYKAHRESMPDDLAPQIPYLHAVIKAMGIPLLALPGMEADDLIGTLARRAEKEGHRVLISTGDKDMAQLVNDNIILEDSFRERVLDHDGVFEKFGVYPYQIIDYLTLMGDASDGIAGIPGVGAKTAAKLLAEYDNIGRMLENVNNIKGKVGQNIKEYAHLIPLNHQLASIVDNLPLDFAWTEMALGTPQASELKRLYTQLEFRGMLQDVSHPNNPVNDPAPSTAAVKVAPSYPTTNEQVITEHRTSPTQTGDNVSYSSITTMQDFDSLLARIVAQQRVAFDTETTSLNYKQAELVGVSFALQAGEAHYVPLAHQELTPQLALADVLAKLKPILQNPEIKKIGHHLKYDAHVLQNYGITLAGWGMDTMLASYVLNPNASRHGLDVLALRYLNHQTTSYEQVTGKGVKQLPFAQVPVQVATKYACEDADMTWRLYALFAPQFAADELLAKLLDTVEMPSAQVLWQMEENGVLIDVPLLKSLSATFAEQMLLLEQKVFAEAGMTFNVASPKQLGEVLFDKMGIAGGKKTASGQYGTSESVLEKIEHPIVASLLEYRTLAKLKNTYTDKLGEQLDGQTKRLHTSYHQALTATGRLSSTDPNLQNIPIRGESGRLIRKAFVAPAGHVLLAADYSQIELRLMAHFSQDEALLHAFKNNLDVHAATAAEVLGLPVHEVTTDQRRQAKAINFGLLYGMSAFGLAKQLGFGRAQAQAYIDVYFERYPGVREYMMNTRAQALEHGYVQTILGRKLYTPDINNRNGMIRQAAERAAINAPLQGSAADLIKLAMVQLQEPVAASKGKMLLQVHDELIIEVGKENAAALKQQIKNVMEQVFSLSVPLVVEVGEGLNWDEAH